MEIRFASSLTFWLLLVILAVQLAITLSSLYHYILETDFMTTTSKKPLFDRMAERADRDKLPDTHELRTLSTELRRLVEMSAGAHLVVPAWARARRAWCRYTGEKLL